MHFNNILYLQINIILFIMTFVVIHKHHRTNNLASIRYIKFYTLLDLM